MASEIKYLCKCGNHVDKLTTYSNNKGAITVCDNCAELHNLKGVHPITKERLFTESEYTKRSNKTK